MSPLPPPGAPEVVIRECPRCRVPTYGDATPVHAPLCALVGELQEEIRVLSLRLEVLEDRTRYR